MKQLTIVAFMAMCACAVYAQPITHDTTRQDSTHCSILGAYELGEMALNKFQNFAGEIGFKFRNDHTLRFVYMNVKLTEWHLASPFANVVKGKQVVGLMKGYELFYDQPLIRFPKQKGYIYGSIAAGYYENSYQHTVLNESITNQSATLGVAVGYMEKDIFGIKGLYFNFSLPLRYYFNPIPKTQLGNSTVRRHLLENNIWFFIGYELNLNKFFTNKR